MNIPFYAINLKRCPEKREHILAECSKIGVVPTILDATDGRNLTNSELDIYSPSPELRPLSKGEIATAISHRRTLLGFLESKEDFCVILEDDVVFDQSVLAAIQGFKTDLHAFDVLFLGQHTHFSNEIPVATLWSSTVWRRPIERVIGAYAYLVSRNGAQKLLELSQKIDKPWDHYTGDFKNLNSWVHVPVLVRVREDFLDNSILNLERKTTQSEQPLYRMKQFAKGSFIYSFLRCASHFIQQIFRWISLFPSQWIATKKKKNQLLLITNFCPHYRIRTYEELDRNFDIRFLFYSDASEPYWEKKNTLPTYSFRNRTLPGINIGSRFRISISLILELLSSESEFVVQSLTGRFAVPVTFLLCRILGKKYILWTGLWAHPNSFFHTLTYPLTKYLYRNADAVLVYGSHVRKYLQNIGVDNGKIFEFWQCVDTVAMGKEIPAHAKESILKTLSPNGRPVVLFVGRIDEVKGLDVLIRASAIAQSKIPHELVLVGNGPEKSKLEELAKTLGIQATFLGHIPNEDLPGFYAACQVFVLPSREMPMFREPWGLVLNEAMLQGCVPVASTAVGAAVGGLFDQEMQNDLIFADGDPDDLAAKLQAAISQSMVKGTREKVRKIALTFTPERQASGLKEAISFLSKKKEKQ